MFPIIDKTKAQLTQAYDEAVVKNQTTRAAAMLTAREICNECLPDIEQAQLRLLDAVKANAGNKERTAAFLEAMEILGGGRDSAEYRAAAVLVA